MARRLVAQKKYTEYTCSLCERAVSQVTKHHIVPKSEGGKQTVDLCMTCHATLHRYFTNETLAREKSSIEALRADPDIARYLQWIKKQNKRIFRVKTRKNRY
jgi:5-methylcytosine-specific restriction endonuclease McrA